MHKFVYKAILEDGQVVDGDVEAANRSAAIRKLAEEKRTILELSDPDPGPSLVAAPFVVFTKVSTTALAFTTRQFAELLRAGVPILEALETTVKFTSHKKLRESLEKVSKRLSSGSTLSSAFAEQPQIYPKLLTNLVKIGESSGQLSEMVEKAADYLDQEVELRARVRSILVYPLFVLGFCTLLCYLMVAYLLPGFEPIWTQSGLDLSRYPLTEFLLKLSDMSHNIWDELLVVAILFGLYFGLSRFLSSADGSRLATETSLKLPVFGHYLRLAASSRVINSLACLVSSGVPLHQACQISASISGNVVIEEAMNNAVKGIENGKTLAESLAEPGVFPALFIQMVGVGEQSGSLDTMLERIGKYYEKELEHTTKSLSSLLEPITIVVVGCIVGVFVLGTILPIMGLVSSISPS